MKLELTWQQRHAMLAFLWNASARGFDDEAYDASVWDCGVRPWPTMANLCKKGLVESVEWFGPVEGWLYRLTEAGRDYMRTVVAERRTDHPPA